MTKKLFVVLITALFLFTGLPLYSQVGINPDGSNPDPSAGLDVKFDNKGFLAPRMTQAQRDAIAAPAEGLMVICTDCGLNNPVVVSFFINGAWRLLTGYCSVPASPPAGTHVATLTQIIWNWNPVTGATGYKWGTTNNVAAALNMGTGTSKTETGLTCNTLYTRYIWAYSDCGYSPVTITSRSTSTSSPSTPVAGTHIAGITQIQWNWNPVTGATGYKWNTTNNYATATDLGTATTKTETGLTCNTGYTRYVWAYGACGYSGSTALTKSTLTDPPASPVAGIHVAAKTQIVWNWNPVTGATGYKWNTTNNPATATDMAAATTKTETGLTCNTPYTRYIWAYGPCGTSTSTILTKTTSVCVTTPVVSTSGVSGITSTTATCGGNVTSDGGGTVTARGVCWSTSPNPTAAGAHTSDGSGTGTFVSNLTGLSSNTLYYIRAFATNSAGTAYGNEGTFTTQTALIKAGYTYMSNLNPPGGKWIWGLNVAIGDTTSTVISGYLEHYDVPWCTSYTCCDDVSYNGMSIALHTLRPDTCYKIRITGGLEGGTYFTDGYVKIPSGWTVLAVADLSDTTKGGYDSLINNKIVFHSGTNYGGCVCSDCGRADINYYISKSGLVIPPEAISSARLKGAGAFVSVSGLATNGQELGNSVRYLQDPTAGINSFKSGSFANISRGDSIVITGVLSLYNQLLELNPVCSVIKISSGHPLPQPVLISPGQLGEQYESELVKMSNVTFAGGGGVFTGNTNYDIYAGGETAQVRINSNSNLVGQTIPTGLVTLIGICSQFHLTDPDSGYQLLLRDTNDIQGN